MMSEFIPTSIPFAPHTRFMSEALPLVIADGPLDATVQGFINNQVELLPWSSLSGPIARPIAGLYTYGHPTVDDSILEKLPGLRVISNYGVGVDHIDLQAAAARGIPVGNTPDILNGATADQAMALLLAAGRRVVEGDHYARGPDFLTYDPGLMLGQEVHGATIGIIGLGRIGQEIAKRAYGFEMTILYHNRRPREDAQTLWGAVWRTLPDLLEHSDYVVLSCPLTPDTHHLIGLEELKQMKNTATLINVARGGVVDTEALSQALENGWIRGAGLDVTEPEPLPREHPLLKFPQVVITPHLGSATVQTRRAMAQLSVANLLHGVTSQPLLRQVGRAT
jgi:glyoxylate reductase